MRGQIAHFLDHIAYERGLAANTRSAYETDLFLFAAFLEARYGLTRFTQVTREHIAAFLDDQRQLGRRATTRARRPVSERVTPTSVTAASGGGRCDVATRRDGGSAGWAWSRGDGAPG